MDSPLRISKITQSKGPDTAQFWTKPFEAVWDRWKTTQRFRENIFFKHLSKMGYLETKNMWWWLSNLHRGQLDPAIKSKSNFQIFHSKTIVSLENGGKGQISLKQLLNRDGPIVHWSESCPLKRSLVGESVHIRTKDSLKWTSSISFFYSF